MIRMTKLTDYAIVLLSHYARNPERPILTARDLAGENHLPLPTVGKILKGLARRGILTSHRGVNGGYSLARRPESISVADVLTALEGPVAITDCSAHGDHGRCTLSHLCPVRTNWQRINEAVWEALGRITLAELSHPASEPLVTLSPGTRIQSSNRI